MDAAHSLFQSPEFRRWLQRVRAGEVEPVARGNQGTLWRYQNSGLDLAVKCSIGNWLTRPWHRRALRNEYLAYRQLQSLAGIAGCYGMPDRHTLVLEFVPGRPYRQASFTDRALWFENLQQLVDTIHARGVGHGDLKRKENLLAGESGQPYVLDFGTAIIRKPGRHPFNHWLFRFCCKLDNNAVIKHKYHGQYAQVSGSDLANLNYTLPERIWRWLRPRLGIK